MLAFTTREDIDIEHTARRGERSASLASPRSGVRIRQMDDQDLERIMELRKSVRWSADPRAFSLLRETREARWAIAEIEGSGAVVGMVGAVPLGDVGILCHLAVHDDYRKLSLGVRLSSWAVSYLRSRGAEVIRLDSTRQAERLYGSLGFEPVYRRTVYRLDGGILAARLRGNRALDARLRGLRVAPLLFGDLPELYGVDRWSFGGTVRP